jgi:deazaflavin-dependent oxidoreductase (nitroreductase family)
MKAEKTKDVAALLARLAQEEYCYLTTTGRVSGKPHEIEIWFGVLDGRLYLLSGGGEGSDWVKNLRKNPKVSLRIAKHSFAGRARILSSDEADGPVRKLLATKYQGWREGRRLSNWARTALPVVIELLQAA